MKNKERIEKIKQTVLKGVKSKKKEIQLCNWLDFLETELKFPFEASIQESANFELQRNSIIKVLQIENFVDMYGLLVEIRKGRRKYIFPMCELEIVEKQSKNRFIIDAFLEWWEEKYL